MACCSLALLVAALAPAEENSLRLAPSDSYGFLVAAPVAGGASEGATGIHWSVNDRSSSADAGPELFLLPADGTMRTPDGRLPLSTPAVLYQPGRWGRSFVLPRDEQVSYSAAGALRLDEGTIEFWICPLKDGFDPACAKAPSMVSYGAPNGDKFAVLVATTGVICGGATVGGRWESAYSDQASIKTWKAGTWHHIAFVYSARGSFMRFYIDGDLRGDTNEGHYFPPSGAGKSFSLGSRFFRMDSVRIWDAPLDADVVRENATRTEAPASGESWLRISGLNRGDRIVCNAGGRSGSFTYEGPPLFDPSPASGLLPPGSTSVSLRIRSSRPAACRYSVGRLLDFDRMTPLPDDTGKLDHLLRIDNLSADPSVVNEVYIRCSLAPAFSLKLRYRSLPRPDSSFPRIANLWDQDPLAPEKKEYLEHLKLIAPGKWLSPAELQKMHADHPSLLIIASLQPFEYFESEPPIPDEYYLKDTKGNRICLWPGSSRLNLTKPEVVDFNTRKIYRIIADSGFLYDGAFIDSFHTRLSWLTTDSYGRPVDIDADGDGREDDPQVLDRAWRAGVLTLVEKIRDLMPNAILTGHLGDHPLPDLGRLFNGDNIAFSAINVIEGKEPFDLLLERYEGWFRYGRTPGVSVIDTGAGNQLGYGYGVYSSFQEAERSIPTGVLEFARTWYPSMRFGLTLALMDDGYFERHFSDVLYCVNWWYDEFGFDLGRALGPHDFAMPVTGVPNLIGNGDFESGRLDPWTMSVDSPRGAAASFKLAPGSPSGSGSRFLRAEVTSRGDGEIYRINLRQQDICVNKGMTYELAFTAKADAPRTIGATLQRPTGGFEILGFWKEIPLGTEWKQYRYRFEATETYSDAAVQFFLAGSLGTVWLDDVSFTEAPPSVFRRFFVNGAAIINATPEPRTVKMPPGYSRISGAQAPRWQYLLDDDAATITFSGSWTTSRYDTPAWKPDPPFYHNWGETCRESRDPGAQAEWNLAIPRDGTYSISAWWTAAPGQKDWTAKAAYEVVSQGRVLASAVLDQRADGDAWHVIAKVALTQDDRPVVRLRNKGGGVLYADALLVASEARYNDGSPAREVVLAPWDGIILRRE